jgi:hypothetical protein
MMNLTVSQINNTLSGVYGTEKYNIPYTKEVYDELVELETQLSEASTLQEAQAIVELAKVIIEGVKLEKSKTQFGEYIVRDNASNKFYLKLGDLVSSKALPQALVDMLLEAIDKEMPIEPYVKCWTWFLKNPRYSDRKAQYFAHYLTTKYVDQERVVELMEDGYSQDEATKLATFNDLSITKNGLLSTYKYAQIVGYKFDPATGDKVARYETTYDPETGAPSTQMPESAEEYTLMPPIMGESGDAFFTGEALGHRIVVGQTHKLPTNALRNTKDGSFGGGGLHLGGLKYIESYGGQNRLLLNCFVNPMHILGFTDGGDGAIRNDEYFVHSACFAPNTGFYNESNYLAQGKEQWEVMLKEGIETTNKIKEALDQQVAELQAL